MTTVSHLVAEKEFQATVREVAKALGWESYTTWNSIHSPQGFPDLFMVRGPRAVAAELKRMNGKPTPAQIKWLSILAQVPGIETFLWRPCDWDQIKEVLK